MVAIGLALLLIALATGPSLAATEAGALQGETLGLFWALPFLGLLLSIALAPLLAPQFWHRHFGKISLLWSLAFVIPAGLLFGWAPTGSAVIQTLLHDYFPFIIILLALFVIAGGILVSGTLKGTPSTNTGMLALGTALASFIGTTGAAMVLIRPMIRANRARRRSYHIFIFFIFLIGNIGGSLTPLGPPLFMGYLKGVDFFWTLEHAAVPTLMVTAILLVIFFIVDFVFRLSDPAVEDTSAPAPLRVHGLHNIAFMIAAIIVVMLSGSVQTGVSYNVLGEEISLEALLRDGSLLLLAGLSFASTSRLIQTENAFTLAPIREVAVLFFGIFITMIPALAILRAGEHGAMREALALVSNPDGSPNNAAYFWLSGLLSSFLDNAPTYLAFFNLAGGNAEELMGPLAATLLAISCGASFMGANTYIGNAPNFMVKAICEENKIQMPSFLGFMLWSGIVLIPIFVMVSWIFFSR